MKNNHKISIDGIEWDLNFLDGEEETKLVKNGYSGESRHDELSIDVVSSDHEINVFEVFIHEVLHVIERNRDIQEWLCVDYDNMEKAINQFGKGVGHFVWNNIDKINEIVIWLKNKKETK